MPEKDNGAAVSGAPQSLRYCLYARKSMESEERQVLSIDSQIKEMQRLAERDGLEIVETKRESHSAKDVGHRPVFNELLEGVKNGKYNAILTWAPDRLSRNAGDLGALVDLMDQKLLLEIRTYQQRFTNSPNEKFLLMILGSQAKLENDAKGVNVSRGLRASVEKGHWPGLAPIGYLNMYRTDMRGQLVIDPDRAPYIKQMFEKVADHEWSVRKVFSWLKDEVGFRTRNGKVFSLSSVYHALQSSFYTGRFEFPRGSGKWYDGSHEPLIDQELFDRVQDRIRKEHTVRERREFAFTRLLTCGICGSGITATERFKRLKSGGTAHYVYYGCTRGRDPNCPAKYIREENLLSELLKIIDSLDVNELEIQDKLAEELRRFNTFQQLVFGKGPDKVQSPKIDLRTYAKYILREGSLSEKREVLAHLRNKLVLKDGRLSLVK